MGFAKTKFMGIHLRTNNPMNESTNIDTVIAFRIVFRVTNRFETLRQCTSDIRGTFSSSISGLLNIEIGCLVALNNMQSAQVN